MSIEDQLLRAQEQLHDHAERIRNQRAEIVRLTKERDAARIDREELRKTLTGWVDAAEKFMLERDEAIQSRDLARKAIGNCIVRCNAIARERDEAEASDARHLALLLQQRAKTRRFAEIADSLWKQRDEHGSEPIDPIPQGTWPADCVQRAFVEGFKWYIWNAHQTTVFEWEIDEAIEEAVRRYGEPKREERT